MESAKENPGVLDSTILDAAIKSCEKSSSFFPLLRLNHDFLKRKLKSTKHIKGLEDIKIDQLHSMHEQSMFLMENLHDYAQNHEWDDSVLEIMENIFGVLNEASGIDMDASMVVKRVVNLKKKNSTHTQSPHKKEEVEDEVVSDKSDTAFAEIQKLIQALIIRGVHIKQIQGALLTQYIHMMSHLIAATLEDEGPS